MNASPTRPPRGGILFDVLSAILVLIGIGGFGTASAGDVEMFGWTIEAKYACFVYFVLGGLFVWSTLEARRRRAARRGRLPAEARRPTSG